MRLRHNNPNLRFPPPSYRTDLCAYHVDLALTNINQESGFMVSIGELADGELIIALSGINQQALESQLEHLLRQHPMGFPVTFLSNINETQMSPNQLQDRASNQQRGNYQGGNRNCSEPKLIKIAAKLHKALTAMTTIWHGPVDDIMAKNGFWPHKNNRAPVAPIGGSLNFAHPCDMCRANEKRLMFYLSHDVLS